MDFNRTERRDAGKILGQWLFDGCSVDPRFEGCWRVDVAQCKCSGKEVE
jgi:hypothetical protein